MIKKILSYLSLKSFLLFFSKFSFGRIFTPYFRAFLRVFFSDRKTAFLIRVFASFFGVFRLLNALLGFLIFINLYSYKGWSSIPASMLAFLSLMKKEFIEAINRYFPNFPPFTLPGTFSKTMDNISHSVSDAIHHSPVATDIAYNIAKEVKKVEHLSDSKFVALRKLYSQYTPTWDWLPWNPVEESYNLFTDWKFYFGMILFLGLTYWFFGETIRTKISDLPSNPFKKDDDHGRPGNFQTPQRASGSNDVDVEAQHVNTPGSEFKRAWPGRFYDYLQDRFPWRKSTVARDNANLQPSDLPSAPTHEPTSVESKGKYREVWISSNGSSSTAVEQVSPSDGRRRAPGRADEVFETYRRSSLDEENAPDELAESVNTVTNFWNYFKPKVIPPRFMDDPSYVDPYAHVRTVEQDPYVGQNVFVFQDENGFKSIDKNEQALLRFNEHSLDSVNKGFTPFVEPDNASELGDVPPSLTDDNSTILDDNSVIGDDGDSVLSEVVGNFF